MKQTLGILVLLLCTWLVPAAAQQVEVKVNASDLDLKAAGWTQVEDGEWERFDLDGFVQRFAVGPAAARVALDDYRAGLPGLVEAYMDKPTPELGEALSKLLGSIEAVERAVVGALESPFQTKEACNITVSVSADAYGTGCGAAGDADVSYSNSCRQLCYINSYAYAQAQGCTGPLNSSTDACSDDGVNISCGSFTSENGAKNCSSYASSSIYCDTLGSTSPFYLSASDSNSTCCGQQLCCACALPG